MWWRSWRINYYCIERVVWEYCSWHAPFHIIVDQENPLSSFWAKDFRWQEPLQCNYTASCQIGLPRCCQKLETNNEHIKDCIRPNIQYYWVSTLWVATTSLMMDRYQITFSGCWQHRRKIVWWFYERSEGTVIQKVQIHLRNIIIDQKLHWGLPLIPNSDIIFNYCNFESHHHNMF